MSTIIKNLHFHTTITSPPGALLLLYYSTTTTANWCLPLLLLITNKKKNKVKSVDFLLQELVNQQNLYLRSQQKVMKLKAERDVEEVRVRYLTLDLNNAQVAVEEEKEKCTNLRKAVSRYAKTNRCSKIENWITRVVIILYTLFYIYSTYFSPK